MFLLVFRGPACDDVPVYATPHRAHAVDFAKIVDRATLDEACNQLDGGAAWICSDPNSIWLIEFSDRGQVVRAEVVRDLEEQPLL